MAACMIDHGRAHVLWLIYPRNTSLQVKGCPKGAESDKHPVERCE